MKTSIEDEKKNSFVIIVGIIFSALSVVSLYNTYRVIMLESEVQQLKVKLSDGEITKIPLKYYRNFGKHAQTATKTKQSKTKAEDDFVLSSEPNLHFKGRHFIYNTMFKDLSVTDMPTPPSYYVSSPNDKERADKKVSATVRKSRSAEKWNDTMKPIIHLVGDTSRYVLGTHENFAGNGRLRHLQRTFVDWKPSAWVEKTGMNIYFIYNDGVLTMKESGIYLIYAQIYYVDVHDLNGYRVYKNGESILQCTVSCYTTQRIEKKNTCYTAGVEYVEKGDKISVADLSDGRYSLFEPAKSFFGIIKLVDIRQQGSV